MHQLSYAPPEPKRRLISTRALLLLASAFVGVGTLVSAKVVFYALMPAKSVAVGTWTLFGPDPLEGFVALGVPLLALPLSLLVAVWALARRRLDASDPRRRVILGVLAIGILALAMHMWSSGTVRQRRITYWGSGGNPKCVGNLRQLSVPLLLYADAHGGVLPDSLVPLVEGPDAPMRPAVLVCPWDDSGGSHEQGSYRSSFVYLGAGKHGSLPSDFVLAYEDPKVHEGGGMYVLFGDGHISYEYDAQGILERLTKGYNPPTTAPAATRPQGGGTK